MLKRFTSAISIKLALPDKFFSRAYSINLGIHHADNEFVCITNGHSLPISRWWLEDGLTHFRDPIVAGVCGYFLPSSSASLREKLYPSLWNLQRKLLTFLGKLLFQRILMGKMLLWRKFTKNYPQLKEIWRRRLWLRPRNARKKL